MFISRVPMFLIAVVTAAVVFLSSPTYAQKIGVYGPGGSLSAGYFAAGAVATVIDEASWRAMGTLEFAEYDILWIEGNGCEQVADVQRAARDTQATWSRAVDGRVAFQSGDLDFHAQNRDGRARSGFVHPPLIGVYGLPSSWLVHCFGAGSVLTFRSRAGVGGAPPTPVPGSVRLRPHSSVSHPGPPQP